jgi:hypothetical protein
VKVLCCECYHVSVMMKVLGRECYLYRRFLGLFLLLGDFHMVLYRRKHQEGWHIM